MKRNRKKSGVCACVYTRACTRCVHERALCTTCVCTDAYMHALCTHVCVVPCVLRVHACACVCMCWGVRMCARACVCCVCACAEVCPPLLWFPECPCKSDPCSQAWTVVRLTPLQTPAPLPGPPRAKLSHRGPRPPCQGNTTNTFLTEFNNMVL